MAQPDPGPLLPEHLDELELICRAGEAGGNFGSDNDFDALDYVLGWHDRHDRQLLEAALRKRRLDKSLQASAKLPAKRPAGH